MHTSSIELTHWEIVATKSSPTSWIIWSISLWCPGAAVTIEPMRPVPLHQYQVPIKQKDWKLTGRTLKAPVFVRRSGFDEAPGWEDGRVEVLLGRILALSLKVRGQVLFNLQAWMSTAGIST